MAFAGAGQALGTIAQKFLMEDAQKHQIRILKNQKQWLYNDLRAAGINPILAVGTGQVVGGAGAPSVGGGGDGTGGEIRAGQLQKAAKEKLLAEAGTAKNMQMESFHRADIAGSLSAVESDNAIIKANEREQSNARQGNVLQGIRSRKELDRVGMPALGMTGADMRNFNIIIQQLRGRDQNAAGRE